MKKILSLLILSAVLVMCLVCCGKDEKPSSDVKAGDVFGENTVGEILGEEVVEKEPEPPKAATVNKSSYSVADDMAWTLDSGVLVISGNGKMPGFRRSSEWPWYDDKKEITKIVIEEGIQSVGESAFYDYSKVKEIVLPSSLVFIDTCAFEGCSNLTSVVIPEGTLSVGQNAFSACFELREVSLPSTLIRIEENGFSSCGELKNINLPESLEYLGESVFSSSGLNEISLPEGLIEIGEEVFWNNYNLETVTLGCSIDMPNIFPECKKIKNVYVSNYYLYENGILYNQDKTTLIAALDMSITQVTIPETVTKISSDAFNKSNLESVVIPANVKSLGDRVFMSCKNLSSVTVENGLESVGKFAFAFCERLSKIDFPESVKSVEYGAFRGCTLDISFASPESKIDFNHDDDSRATLNVTFA